MDGILKGMSKADLEETKRALNDASSATGAFEVAVGALLLLINPGALTATIIIGDLTLMTVGLSFLAIKIDEHLLVSRDRRE